MTASDQQTKRPMNPAASVETAAKREFHEWLLADYNEKNPRYKSTILEIVNKAAQIFSRPTAPAGEPKRHPEIAEQCQDYYVIKDGHEVLTKDGRWVHWSESRDFWPDRASALAFLNEVAGREAQGTEPEPWPERDNAVKLLEIMAEKQSAAHAPASERKDRELPAMEPIAEIQAANESMPYPHIVRLRGLTEADVGARLVPTAELEALRKQVADLKLRLLSAAGDDFCRLTQEEIKALSSGAVQIPPKGEFLASCERFHEQIAAGPGVLDNCLTLAQLIAENEKLSQQLTATEGKLAQAGAPHA